MSVEMKKIAIFLFVFAIGHCAPQKDHVSIAPIKSKVQVSYQLVTPEVVSDSISNPIADDPTPPTTSSTEAPKTTTLQPTVVPTATTTTAPPETTTTTSPETTTTASTTAAPTTTVPSTTVPPTTTTLSPVPTTTTTPSPTTTPTPHPSTTTEKPEPIPCRRFDGPSFIGGIVLTVGLIAISFVVWKFYKSRTERNYHTL